MPPTAASVLSTLHWPVSWSPALDLRAWVVRSEVGCLSDCLIQQEHKGPATVVCTFKTLKWALWCFLRWGGKGVRSEVRAASLRRENETSLWFRLQGKCLAWSGLIVAVMYVWKKLRAAGLFCQCVLVLQRNMQLEKLQRGTWGDEGREDFSRWDVTQW